ncbi:4-hydroxybenzoate octaprenyltransferase [Rickettsiales bacterium]|nr:4-hydroxybenzoate octaprenyltransferase [Rickettsiales bacterium]
MQINWLKYRKNIPFAPYIRLLRINHPIGIILLVWPCWWTIAMAERGSINLGLLIVFGFGAFLMRSAGCIINDILDRDVDAQVRRTKDRPIANGDISVREASLVVVLFLLIGWAILLTLSNTAIILGYLVVIPIIVYPLMKRVTYWPQAFLGLTFNWGVLMGWAAVHDKISMPAILIYIAGVAWTLGYDTIYAHQDKIDDLALGLKSAALKLGRRTKRYLYVFYGTTTICLWAAGILLGNGVLYHLFLVIGALQLFWQVTMVNLDNPNDCKIKFQSNRYYGAIIFLGVLGGKISF